MAVEESARDRARREKILVAAEAVFLQYGWRRTSVEDIAREADIAKGSVYLSFSSKEEVYLAVAATMNERFLSEASAAAATVDELADKLVAYLDGAVGAPSRMIKESAHADELLQSKRSHAAGAFAGFRRALDEGVAALLAGDGIAVAHTPLFVAAAYGCLHTSDGAIEYRSKLHELVETLLAGIAHR